VASNPTRYDDLPDEPLPEQELPPPAPPPGQSWEQRLKRRLGPLGVLIFAAAMWAGKEYSVIGPETMRESLGSEEYK
jgi:hypothetical protein